MLEQQALLHVSQGSYDQAEEMLTLSVREKQKELHKCPDEECLREKGINLDPTAP
jgi:hypothetical protein